MGLARSAGGAQIDSPLKSGRSCQSNGPPTPQPPSRRLFADRKRWDSQSRLAWPQFGCIRLAMPAPPDRCGKVIRRADAARHTKIRRWPPQKPLNPRSKTKVTPSSAPVSLSLSAPMVNLADTSYRQRIHRPRTAHPPQAPARRLSTVEVSFRYIDQAHRQKSCHFCWRQPLRQAPLIEF